MRKRIFLFVSPLKSNSTCLSPRYQVAWSATTVAGQHLSNVLLLSPEERFEIAESTRNKAGAIIAAKGFTSFGVAAATTTLCESIIFDQRQVLPVSHWHDEHECCLSLPAVLGRNGVVETVPFQLTGEERTALEGSAKSIRDVMATCAQYF
jgi:L-lactate dehydrogenase